MKNVKIVFTNSKEIYEQIKFAIPLYKENNNDETIMNFYNNPDNTNIKYYYISELNKKLYEKDLIISIVPNGNPDFAFYFYVILLINQDKYSVLNYEYKIYYIEGLYEQVKKNINYNEINKVLMAKCIIDLIHNYKGTNNYNEEEELVKLNEIENDMQKIINEKRGNILNFSKINFENNIDEIYGEIIISLIKENKFEFYSKIYIIITQLELEKINITYVMLNKIMEYLDINKDYINKNYGITKIEDFLDIKQNINKINFYYIMLKFIFKNSINIYNIPLFFECKKIIMKSKYQLGNLIDYDSLVNDSNTINGRINYIIKTFLDSNYYIKKHLSFYYHHEKKAKKESLETDNKLIYIKSTLISSNHSVLNVKHDKFENNLKTIEEKLKTFNFDDSIVVFHTNAKGKEPFIIYEKLFFESDENEFIKFDEILYYIKINRREQYESKDIEKLNLLFHFLKFLNEIQNELKIGFIGSYNVRIEITFKKKEQSSNYSCYYKLYNPENLDEKWKEYKDLKIFNGELTGLSDMINEINNEKYKNIAYIKYFWESPNNIVVKSNNGSKVLLLKNLKEIENQDYIKIRNEQFYSIKIIQLDVYNKQLFIDSKKEERKLIKIFHDNDNENKNKYIVNYDSNIDIIHYINNNNNDIKINKKTIKNNNTCNLILNHNKNQYIFGGDKGVYMINNIENVIELELNEKDKIISEKVKGGIKFNDYIYAFITNENKLIFFDINIKNIIDYKNEYSIISSPNNSLLIDIESNNKNDNKVILCACKNSVMEDKRGILLIYKNNTKIYYNFKLLEDFDIYCFCKITMLDDNFILKKEEIKNHYLLVAGYDKKNESGLIKLYSVITNNFETNIEFINNIEINSNNNGYIFKDPITSIIQNGQYLLFTCSEKSYKFEFDINLI